MLLREKINNLKHTFFFQMIKEYREILGYMFARTTARTIYYHLTKKLNRLIDYTGKRKEETGTSYLWMAWTIELHCHCPWCPSSVPSVQTVLQIFKLTDLWRFRLTFGCGFSYTTILSRTRDHKVAFGQYTYTPC